MPAPQLQDIRVHSDQWGGLGDILKRDDFRLISKAERENLLRRWSEIDERLKQLDDRLVIGLIGGTGVGKSTFINALGGKEVSRSGDRRPTTDRVVVYRHIHGELPPRLPVQDLSQPQVMHDNAALRRVIILDFPDFDSAEKHHKQILSRYVRHLDILFIVVDDMKYGDARLYELLAILPHDPRNLFVILNKTDRLRQRYGQRAETVADSILLDLRDKLIEHAGIRIRSEQAFSISALEEYQSPLKSEHRESNTGFARIRAILDEYRHEKRRLAAKESNLEIRKAELALEIERLVFSDANEMMLAQARELIDKCRFEASATLRGISSEFLTERERRARRRRRMRQAAARWGLPYSLIFTLLGEMRTSRTAHGEGDLASRILAHYRAYFQLLHNLTSRCAAELSDLTSCDFEDNLNKTSSVSLAKWSATQSSEFQREVGDDVIATTRIRKMASHIPGVAVFLFAIWWILHGPIARFLDPSADGVGGAFIRGIITAISPTFLLGTLFSVMIAYVLTGLWLWARELHNLDREIAQGESKVRRNAQHYGGSIVQALASETERLKRDWNHLKQCLMRE